ncbi:ABC transporter permease subunit [Priestia koreensis]|uniref:ABC transporter permease subunit n=1 Tax=Priestia koreensis TaxID=284581 RepID=UPI00203EAA6B|nr:ABC transporter permease subunit [Priestia koreensis]MCM3005024.1 ABC transporter permease subunit [Priestia koreensis]
MLKTIWKVIFGVLLIAIIAGFPLLQDPERASLIPQFKNALNVIRELRLSSFTTYTNAYSEMGMPLSKGQLWQDIVPLAINSGLMLFYSLMIALVVSMICGYVFHRAFLSKMVRGIISLLAIIPDFVYVLLGIYVAITLYKKTGILLMVLSPKASLDFPLYPLIFLSLTPMMYLIKMLAYKYKELLTEDYIRTAMAKGLSKQYIDLQHVYKNLKPFLQADLKKVISLTVGSLFIVEYLFLIPGLTKLIFIGYEFPKVLIALSILTIIAVLNYYVIQLFLYLFEKVFIRG